MDSDEDKKRRASIAYILRRRKRGRKTGANSGEVVKSWAEYGEVNFTPKGSYASWWQRLIWLAVVPLMVFAPFLIMATTDNAQGGDRREIPAFAWGLYGILGLIVLVLILFAGAYMLLSTWRFVRANFPHKKE